MAKVEALTKEGELGEAPIPDGERFRLLVDAVIDYAIYTLDPTGVVSNWNSGAHRIKGYTAAEIVGQHFSRFYTPEDREAGEPQRALEIAAREGRYEKEAQRLRKDGSRFWANVVIDAIRNDRGELIGFAKITRDITERVEARLELEKAQEAFFQSQKMESLGQLTGGIAHDFNNLLTAVLGSLEMLRKRMPDDPRLLQLLDNAVQGAERGAALTQRMLAFARRQELNLEPLDVPNLVAGLHDLLQRTLGPTISVEMRVADGVRHANADANQLELVILNLAVNARDAMPAGGRIVIDIREQTAGAGNEVAAGDYVCLSLSDNGEGMDAETLARATEPFFTTKGVGRGTGLGLSMVRGFAEQLNGGLVLRSEPGIGTTAELWLPVATSQAEMPIETPSASSQAGVSQRRLTVLAVDDDALVLMNTTAMLEELGHKVLEASSGPAALDVLKREAEIDLVVTDYAMPRMTGAELVSAIRAERPDVTVILATGYAELPHGAQIEAVRLPKPFGLTELARAVAEATKAD